MDVPAAIGHLLVTLKQHADFMMRVAEQRRGSIWFQLNGAEHRGIELSLELLRRMTTLNVALGVEVFPHGLR